jgi:hypothetical protein
MVCSHSLAVFVDASTPGGRKPQPSAASEAGDSSRGVMLTRPLSPRIVSMMHGGPVQNASAAPPLRGRWLRCRYDRQICKSAQEER